MSVFKNTSPSVSSAWQKSWKNWFPCIIFLNIFYTFKQIVSSSKNINSAWVLGIGKLSFSVFCRKMFETIGPSGYLDILRCTNLSIYFQKTTDFQFWDQASLLHQIPSQAKPSWANTREAKPSQTMPSPEPHNLRYRHPASQTNRQLDRQEGLQANR